MLTPISSFKNTMFFDNRLTQIRCTMLECLSLTSVPHVALNILHLLNYYKLGENIGFGTNNDYSNIFEPANKKKSQTRPLRARIWPVKETGEAMLEKILP